MAMIAYKCPHIEVSCVVVPLDEGTEPRLALRPSSDAPRLALGAQVVVVDISQPRIGALPRAESARPQGSEASVPRRFQVARPRLTLLSSALVPQTRGTALSYPSTSRALTRSSRPAAVRLAGAHSRLESCGFCISTTVQQLN